MKKQDLVNLSFNRPKGPLQLIDLVNSLIVDADKIPMAVSTKGLIDYKDKRASLSELSICYLKPLNTSDGLTVMNFLEGLRQVKEELIKKDQSKPFDNFIGLLAVHNIRFMHHSNYQSKIIEMYADIWGNNGGFGLDIFWVKDNLYRAESAIGASKIEAIMERYIGPNKVPY